MYNDISAQAQSAANTFRDSLQYLVDAQNQQKLLDEQSSSQRYQNLLNQINQQRVPLQEQYAADTQSAYINKMLAGRQIGQQLNQLGLNTQGFGVSQMLQNETAYGQNLNQLTLGRNQALQGLDNQVVNATGEYNAGQLALSSTYAGRLADLQKYIGEQSQNQYNNAYSQLAESKAYEDQLKQIAWENDYKNRQLAEQKRQANLTTEQYKFEGPKPETINVTTDYFNGQMPQATFNDLQKGAFGTKDKNGVQYQPNNIKGVKFTGSVGKAGTITGNKNILNTSGVNIANQNVWKLPDGTLWVWNGSKMKYEQIKESGRGGTANTGGGTR